MRYALFLAASVLSAQSWRDSVVTLSAATVTDMISSRNCQELNPILGRGLFGPRQIAIKSGITGGLILGEYLWLRHHPRDARIITAVNFSASGVTFGVAIRNWRRRK